MFKTNVTDIFRAEKNTHILIFTIFFVVPYFYNILNIFFCFIFLFLPRIFFIEQNIIQTKKVGGKKHRKETILTNIFKKICRVCTFLEGFAGGGRGQRRREDIIPRCMAICDILIKYVINEKMFTINLTIFQILRKIMVTNLF